MKELSIEEKAKRYDNLIERLKDFQFEYRFSAFSDTIEAKFPELKESEDERIRKEILDCFRAMKQQGCFPSKHKEQYDSWIAWLEKQGNLMKALQTSNSRIAELVEEKYNLEEKLKKQGEKELDPRYSILDKLIEADNIYQMSVNDEMIAEARNKAFSALTGLEISKLLKLEKQGEQKPAEEYNITGIKSRNAQGKLGEMIKNLKPVNEVLEQKPTDKVEPKFKVGDWIIFNGLTLYIKEVVKGFYRTISKGGIANSYDWDIDNAARLWTIQDSKDGDVLACENGWTCIFKKLVNDETFSSYCFMDNTKWFCETGSECHTLKEEFVKAYNGKLYPATKEQRDLLFQKMKEAGYEWDARKKELKKIGNENPMLSDFFKAEYERGKTDAQKPAEWSEEDELMLNDIITCNERRGYITVENIAWLKSLRGRVQPKQEWSEEDKAILEKCIGAVKVSCYSYSFKLEAENWLKSLRPQNRWKPSDEQMDALRYVTNFDYGGYKAILVSLYEQLKKLREE